MPLIIGFSGLGDKIDVPVGMYSSGMRVRLGFSIASALDPDIILLDEVFAVGDLEFRERCIQRLRQLRGRTALIVVTQNPALAAKLADRMIWLDAGTIRMDGSADEVSAAYFDHVRGQTPEVTDHVFLPKSRGTAQAPITDA
jgi:lipopolysaccharide transport system ATP-binding protein